MPDGDGPDVGEITRRALRAFKAQGRTEIDVPEWPDDDGNPTVLYSPPWTVNQQNVLARTEGRPNQLLEIVVLMCEHEDGSKVFGTQDKPALRKAANAAVIERIAERIMQFVQGPDEAEGN